MPAMCSAKTRSPCLPSRCFRCCVLCALLGPSLVPYDPLASDTARALTGPSAAHLFGTDQLGRDIFSRIIVATRLDLGIAFTSVALAFAIGTLLGLVGGLFRRLDRPHHRPDRRHDHGLSAVRAGDGHRRRARQHASPTSSTRPRSSTCRSMPGSPAPRPTSGARPGLSRRRGCAATARRASSWRSCCPTSCR